MTLTANDALRMAAALVIHAKRGTDASWTDVAILQSGLTTTEDAIRVNNSLLALIGVLAREASVQHIERVMGQCIAKVARDDAAGAG